MKGPLTILCLICLVLFTSSPLVAGGIDNRSNFSGEYVRIVNRNAATDSLDAIVYNPAGVMAMETGTQANFSIHYVLKDYSNSVDGVKLEQDTPSILPALFGLVKRESWAAFLAFTVPAGGGECDYDTGSATTRIGAKGLVNTLNSMAGAAVYGPVSNERLEGKSYYYALTGGGARRINDILSVSLAGRYIIAEKSSHATFQAIPTVLGAGVGLPSRTAILDYEETARGFGAILGLNINYDPFLFTLKYETETNLDFTYDVNSDSVTGLPSGLGASMGIVNDTEHSRNLPALLALGGAYRISPSFRVDLNFTCYFQEDANWGGDEKMIDDGWEAGIGIEYIIRPGLKWSLGYLYTKTGEDVRFAIKEAPALDANTFGTGIVYNPNEILKIDLGVGLADYKGESYVDISSGSAMVIGLEKDVLMFSAGVEYRF